MLQENPIWNGEAFSKDVREPDAYCARDDRLRVPPVIGLRPELPLLTWSAS